MSITILTKHIHDLDEAVTRTHPRQKNMNIYLLKQFEEAMLRRGGVPPELHENKDLMGIFTPLWFADLR